MDSRESSFSIKNASKTLKLLNFIRIVNRLLKDCTVKEDAIFERKPFLLVRKRAAINNGFKVFTKFHSINHYPISVFMRNFLSPTWENQIGSIFKLNIKKKSVKFQKILFPQVSRCHLKAFFPRISKQGLLFDICDFLIFKIQSEVVNISVGHPVYSAHICTS